MYLVYTAVIDI